MRKLLIIVVTLGLLASTVNLPAQPAAGTAVPLGGKNITAQEIARNLSMLTGVAISPLLGVGLVGWYQDHEAKTDAERARLSWYSKPEFYLPALIIVLLCFVKDTAGTALPTALKKPLDVLETVEHKISGLVATGAFVPLFVTTFHSHIADGACLGSLGFATADLHWLYNLLMVPVSMVAFFIVFLASNAINILILLSPFTTVDAALKGVRGAVLASVAASAWMNPWIGAVWAVGIILFSYFIAGWSFRLTHFGLVFIWETLTFRRSRFTPDAKVNRFFLARKINQVPGRTYGKLSRDDQGSLVFDYHPWLVLPQRTMTLPAGKYDVGRGVFYSQLMRVEGDSTRMMLLLPPRYRGHEEQLVGIYKFGGVRPAGLLAAWAWLKGMIGGTRTEAAA